MTALVQFAGVHKFFDDLHVLKGVDLEVQRGEVCVLMGPSGSGKSTLLRLVNGLESVSAGRVLFNDELLGMQEKIRGGKPVLFELSAKQLAAQRSRIGMVFQRFNLFPHLTALENVMEAPLHVLKRPAEKVRQQALELLERVGLADRVEHFPSQLSGGQQQRVAIARALAMEPELMLFDEPTSALDPELVGEVLTVMKDLAASGMTMLVVTHEVEFARQVADHVVFMDGGVVVSHGSAAQVIDNPTHPRAQEFFGQVSA